jgi:hypothetical protein
MFPGKYSMSISMIVPILRKAVRGCSHDMGDILTKLDKLNIGHNTAPRVKKAWVRKVDNIHPLSGSGSGFT